MRFKCINRFGLLRAVCAAALIWAAAAPVFAQDTAAAAPVSALDTAATAPVSALDTAATAPASALDEVVMDPAYVPEGGIQTESEIIPLMETEMVYEIPVGIADGLQKDTPTGEAADMTPEECDEFMDEICLANAAGTLWKKHEDVTASFRLFDDASHTWKEYCVTYADPVSYYSDDWTPGVEELRLLIYKEDSCIEDYTVSIRFVNFLNASGTAFRDPKTAPVTLDSHTRDEMLLSIHRTPQALFATTRLTESSILQLGLDAPQEEAFYSSLYVLDPATLEVQVIQISLHHPDGTVSDVRNISYSYDHGMSPFVETGYTALMRHLDAGAAFAPEDLRTVRVIRDPAAPDEETFLLTALKGDAVSITLPDGYALYSDKDCTFRWVDNGDYVSDLTLWAAPE